MCQERGWQLLLLPCAKDVAWLLHWSRRIWALGRLKTTRLFLQHRPRLFLSSAGVPELIYPTITFSSSSLSTESLEVSSARGQNLVSKLVWPSVSCGSRGQLGVGSGHQHMDWENVVDE